MGQSENLKSILQRLDDYDFEHLIADLWQEQGWETRVLQASNDRGIDVEARRADPFEQKHLIRAKRYSKGNNIGSEAIQQYASLRHQEENVDAVIIVTTSDFTRQAEEIAADLNLKLINGDGLVHIIQDQNAGEIVEKYASVQPNNIDTKKSSRKTSSTQSPQKVNSDRVKDIYVSKLVDNAMGNLVTENRLIKLKPGITHPQTLTTDPIIGHLYKGEQPHFTFHCKKIRIPDRGLIQPANNAYLVVTDRRILVLLGEEKADREITISFRQIEDVDCQTITSSGFNISRKIILRTDIGEFRFKTDHSPSNESNITDSILPHKDPLDEEVEHCTQFIKECVYSLM